MSKSKYPKVLIVGHYPGNYNGPTITLKSLFSEWPPQNLAVSSSDSFDKMYSERCNYYYVFGEKEIIIKGLQKLIYKTNKSGAYNNTINTDLYINSRRREKKSTSLKQLLLTHIIKPFFVKTGLYFNRFNYKVSSDYINWIEQFNPDIILTMLGDISSMKLALELKKKTQRKLAIYIADDWVHANPHYSWFPKFWKKRFEKLFKKVIDVSDIRLAICDKMANEYEELYNSKFIAYHNPVDVSEYRKLFSKKITDSNNEFVITYVGKINKDTIDGLLDMIEAIKQINDEKINFYIYAGSNNKKVSKIKGNNYVHLMPQVSHTKIPEILVNSNLLFIPLSFKKVSRRYTRLSMPTKASESMISKTPIIIYAPKEIALTEYAIDKKWAFVVPERNIDLLKETIIKAREKNVNIDEIINNAYYLALSKHSTEIVRNSFRNTLISVK